MQVHADGPPAAVAGDLDPGPLAGHHALEVLVQTGQADLRDDLGPEVGPQVAEEVGGPVLDLRQHLLDAVGGAERALPVGPDVGDDVRATERPAVLDPLGHHVHLGQRDRLALRVQGVPGRHRDGGLDVERALAAARRAPDRHAVVAEVGEVHRQLHGAVEEGGRLAGLRAGDGPAGLRPGPAVHPVVLVAQPHRDVTLGAQLELGLQGGADPPAQVLHVPVRGLPFRAVLELQLGNRAQEGEVLHPEPDHHLARPVVDGEGQFPDVAAGERGELGPQGGGVEEALRHRPGGRPVAGEGVLEESGDLLEQRRVVPRQLDQQVGGGQPLVPGHPGGRLGGRQRVDRLVRREGAPAARLRDRPARPRLGRVVVPAARVAVDGHHAVRRVADVLQGGRLAVDVLADHVQPDAERVGHQPREHLAAAVGPVVPPVLDGRAQPLELLGGERALLPHVVPGQQVDQGLGRQCFQPDPDPAVRQVVELLLRRERPALRRRATAARLLLGLSPGRRLVAQRLGQLAGPLLQVVVAQRSRRHQLVVRRPPHIALGQQREQRLAGQPAVLHVELTGGELPVGARGLRREDRGPVEMVEQEPVQCGGGVGRRRQLLGAEELTGAQRVAGHHGGQQFEAPGLNHHPLRHGQRGLHGQGHLHRLRERRGLDRLGRLDHLERLDALGRRLARLGLRLRVHRLLRRCVQQIARLVVVPPVVVQRDLVRRRLVVAHQGADPVLVDHPQSEPERVGEQRREGLPEVPGPGVPPVAHRRAHRSELLDGERHLQVRPGLDHQVDQLFMRQLIESDRMLTAGQIVELPLRIGERPVAFRVRLLHGELPRSHQVLARRGQLPDPLGHVLGTHPRRRHHLVQRELVQAQLVQMVHQLPVRQPLQAAAMGGRGRGPVVAPDLLGQLVPRLPGCLLLDPVEIALGQRLQGPHGRDLGEARLLDDPAGALRITDDHRVQQAQPVALDRDHVSERPVGAEGDRRADGFVLLQLALVLDRRELLRQRPDAARAQVRADRFGRRPLRRVRRAAELEPVAAGDQRRPAVGGVAGPDGHHQVAGPGQVHHARLGDLGEEPDRVVPRVAVGGDPALPQRLHQLGEVLGPHRSRQVAGREPQRPHPVPDAGLAQPQQPAGQFGRRDRLTVAPRQAADRVHGDRQEAVVPGEPFECGPGEGVRGRVRVVIADPDHRGPVECDRDRQLDGLGAVPELLVLLRGGLAVALVEVFDLVDQQAVLGAAGRGVTQRPEVLVQVRDRDRGVRGQAQGLAHQVGGTADGHQVTDRQLCGIAVEFGRQLTGRPGLQTGPPARGGLLQEVEDLRAPRAGAAGADQLGQRAEVLAAAERGDSGEPGQRAAQFAGPHRVGLPAGGERRELGGPLGQIDPLPAALGGPRGDLEGAAGLEHDRGTGGVGGEDREVAGSAAAGQLQVDRHGGGVERAGWVEWAEPAERAERAEPAQPGEVLGAHLLPAGADQPGAAGGGVEKFADPFQQPGDPAGPAGPAGGGREQLQRLGGHPGVRDHLLLDLRQRGLDALPDGLPVRLQLPVRQTGGRPGEQRAELRVLGEHGGPPVGRTVDELLDQVAQRDPAVPRAVPLHGADQRAGRAGDGGQRGEVRGRQQLEQLGGGHPVPSQPVEHGLVGAGAARDLLEGGPAQHRGPLLGRPRLAVAALGAREPAQLQVGRLVRQHAVLPHLGAQLRQGDPGQVTVHQGGVLHRPGGQRSDRPGRLDAAQDLEDRVVARRQHPAEEPEQHRLRGDLGHLEHLEGGHHPGRGAREAGDHPHALLVVQVPEPGGLLVELEPGLAREPGQQLLRVGGVDPGEAQFALAERDANLLVVLGGTAHRRVRGLVPLLEPDVVEPVDGALDEVEGVLERLRRPVHVVAQREGVLGEHVRRPRVQRLVQHHPGRAVEEVGLREDLGVVQAEFGGPVPVPGGDDVVEHRPEGEPVRDPLGVGRVVEGGQQLAGAAGVAQLPQRAQRVALAHLAGRGPVVGEEGLGDLLLALLRVRGLQHLEEPVHAAAGRVQRHRVVVPVAAESELERQRLLRVDGIGVERQLGHTERDRAGDRLDHAGPAVGRHGLVAVRPGRVDRRQAAADRQVRTELLDVQLRLVRPHRQAQPVAARREPRHALRVVAEVLAHQQVPGALRTVHRGREPQGALGDDGVQRELRPELAEFAQHGGRVRAGPAAADPAGRQHQRLALLPDALVAQSRQGEGQLARMDRLPVPGRRTVQPHGVVGDREEPRVAREPGDRPGDQRRLLRGAARVRQQVHPGLLVSTRQLRGQLVEPGRLGEHPRRLHGGEAGQVADRRLRGLRQRDVELERDDTDLPVRPVAVAEDQLRHRLAVVADHLGRDLGVRHLASGPARDGGLAGTALDAAACRDRRLDGRPEAGLRRHLRLAAAGRHAPLEPLHRLGGLVGRALLRLVADAVVVQLVDLEGDLDARVGDLEPAAGGRGDHRLAPGGPDEPGRELTVAQGVLGQGLQPLPDRRAEELPPPKPQQVVQALHVAQADQHVTVTQPRLEGAPRRNPGRRRRDRRGNRQAVLGNDEGTGPRVRHALPGLHQDIEADPGDGDGVPGPVGEAVRGGVAQEPVPRGRAPALHPEHQLGPARERAGGDLGLGGQAGVGRGPLEIEDLVSLAGGRREPGRGRHRTGAERVGGGRQGDRGGGLVTRPAAGGAVRAGERVLDGGARVELDDLDAAGLFEPHHLGGDPDPAVPVAEHEVGGHHRLEVGVELPGQQQLQELLPHPRPVPAEGLAAGLRHAVDDGRHGAAAAVPFGERIHVGDHGGRADPMGLLDLQGRGLPVLLLDLLDGSALQPGLPQRHPGLVRGVPQRNHHRGLHRHRAVRRPGGPDARPQVDAHGEVGPPGEERGGLGALSPVDHGAAGVDVQAGRAVGRRRAGGPHLQVRQFGLHRHAEDHAVPVLLRGADRDPQLTAQVELELLDGLHVRHVVQRRADRHGALPAAELDRQLDRVTPAQQRQLRLERDRVEAPPQIAPQDVGERTELGLQQPLDGAQDLAALAAETEHDVRGAHRPVLGQPPRRVAGRLEGRRPERFGGLRQLCQVRRSRRIPGLEQLCQLGQFIQLREIEHQLLRRQRTRERERAVLLHHDGPVVPRVQAQLGLQQSTVLRDGPSVLRDLERDLQLGGEVVLRAGEFAVGVALAVAPVARAVGVARLGRGGAADVEALERPGVLHRRARGLPLARDAVGVDEAAGAERAGLGDHAQLGLGLGSQVVHPLHLHGGGDLHALERPAGELRCLQRESTTHRGQFGGEPVEVEGVQHRGQGIAPGALELPFGDAPGPRGDQAQHRRLRLLLHVLGPGGERLVQRTHIGDRTHHHRVGEAAVQSGRRQPDAGRRSDDPLALPPLQGLRERLPHSVLADLEPGRVHQRPSRLPALGRRLDPAEPGLLHERAEVDLDDGLRRPVLTHPRGDVQVERQPGHAVEDGAVRLRLDGQGLLMTLPFDLHPVAAVLRGGVEAHRERGVGPADRAAERRNGHRVVDGRLVRGRTDPGGARVELGLLRVVDMPQGLHEGVQIDAGRPLAVRAADLDPGPLSRHHALEVLVQTGETDLREDLLLQLRPGPLAEELAGLRVHPGERRPHAAHGSRFALRRGPDVGDDRGTGQPPVVQHLLRRREPYGRPRPGQGVAAGHHDGRLDVQGVLAATRVPAQRELVVAQVGEGDAESERPVQQGGRLDGLRPGDDPGVVLVRLAAHPLALEGGREGGLAVAADLGLALDAGLQGHAAVRRAAEGGLVLRAVLELHLGQRFLEHEVLGGPTDRHLAGPAVGAEVQTPVVPARDRGQLRPQGVRFEELPGHGLGGLPVSVEGDLEEVGRPRQQRGHLVRVQGEHEVGRGDRVPLADPDRQPGRRRAALATVRLHHDRHVRGAGAVEGDVAERRQRLVHDERLLVQGRRHLVGPWRRHLVGPWRRDLLRQRLLVQGRRHLRQRLLAQRRHHLLGQRRHHLLRQRLLHVQRRHHLPAQRRHHLLRQRLLAQRRHHIVGPCQRLLDHRRRRLATAVVAAVGLTELPVDGGLGGTLQAEAAPDVPALPVPGGQVNPERVRDQRREHLPDLTAPAVPPGAHGRPQLLELAFAEREVVVRAVQEELLDQIGTGYRFIGEHPGELGQPCAHLIVGQTLQAIPYLVLNPHPVHAGHLQRKVRRPTVRQVVGDHPLQRMPATASDGGERASDGLRGIERQALLHRIQQAQPVPGDLDQLARLLTERDGFGEGPGLHRFRRFDRKVVQVPLGAAAVLREVGTELDRYGF